MSNYLTHRWMPPALRNALNRCIGGTTRYQRHTTWEKACQSSRGYDERDILARVSRATSLVLEGSAKYEQDGKAFIGAPAPEWPLAGIMLAAALGGDGLRMVDFGGGLGSHFLRWRPWLESLSTLHWCVVEQPHFANEGRRLFKETPQVFFCSSIEQIGSFRPNAVLASSVLQYVSEPIPVLRILMTLKARVVIIDRTPFSRDEATHALTQRVSRGLGAASYPLWALSKKEIYEILNSEYSLLAEFASADDPIVARGARADYSGGVWVRKE